MVLLYISNIAKKSPADVFPARDFFEQVANTPSEAPNSPHTIPVNTEPHKLIKIPTIRFRVNECIKRPHQAPGFQLRFLQKFRQQRETKIHRHLIKLPVLHSER